MAMPKGLCSRCDRPLRNMKMVGEDMLVGDDGDIIAAQRRFVGKCPVHGSMGGPLHIGHHTTIGRKKAKRYFTKARRERLWRLLSSDEFARFSGFVHGHNTASRDEVVRWKRLSNEPRLSEVSAWMSHAQHV